MKFNINFFNAILVHICLYYPNFIYFNEIKNHIIQ